MIEIQVRRSPEKNMFTYASTAVPQPGDGLALTIREDGGFVNAEVLDVVHVPFRSPRPVMIDGVLVTVGSQAIVIIEGEEEGAPEDVRAICEKAEARWAEAKAVKKQGPAPVVAAMAGRHAIAEQEAANAVGALQMVRTDPDFDGLHEVTREAVVDVVDGTGAAAQERLTLLKEGVALLRSIYEDKGETKWGANGANTYHIADDVLDVAVGSYLARLDATGGDL